MTADDGDFADVQSSQRKYGGFAAASPDAVMWSETVGLRTRPVSDQKKIDLGLGLAGLVLMIMIMTSSWGLQQRPTSPITKKYNTPKIKMGNEAVQKLQTSYAKTSNKIHVVLRLCLEHHYCGEQQWRLLTQKLNPPSDFVYFRWSWSWSCYFGLGLGLGLKNFVLFTSLPR